MTKKALEEAIRRLITKRSQTDFRDTEELKRINTKLNKLYDLHYIMLGQLQRA